MATAESARGQRAPPKPPPLTKAERRAKQERERAAKEAAKAQAAQGGGSSKASGSRPAASGPSQQQQQPRASRVPEASRPQHPSRDLLPVVTNHEAVAQQTRGLRIFSHFGIPRDTKTLKLKDTTIHPAIVRLGLQFSEFKVVGANARCVAMFNTFKTVIRDYETPPDQAMSRDLTTYLSPQINHLVTSRPMAVSMGNAIRYLKVEISVLEPSLPEQDAKELLCEKIDHYLRDNINLADKVIQEVAASKINDGDVVLAYARSSVVEKVLLYAHSIGKQFSVIVVDSRPLLEGKRLLSKLAEAGIDCTYLLLTALDSVIRGVSLVLLGAHSVQSDGAIYSRAGTALVAMTAKSHSVPTLVCCETYKLSEAVHLDSFSKNELAPPTSLLSSYSSVHEIDKLALTEQPNLRVLNPLYDLTPPAYITAIVTEVGTIPPNSVGSLPGALGRAVNA